MARQAELYAVDVNDSSGRHGTRDESARTWSSSDLRQPLVAGVADAVRAAGIACFGPSAAAAELEASKAFAKQVMHAASVPTARAGVGTDIDTVS